MEFDTAPTGFSIAAKPSGFNASKRKLDDDWSHGSIINFLPQEAVKKRVLALSFEQQPMGDVSHPFLDNPPSYGSLSMQSLIASPVGSWLGPFSCPPPDYETATWNPFNTEDQNSLVSTGSNVSVGIQADVAPLESLGLFSPEDYGLDDGSGFCNPSCPDLTAMRSPISIRPGVASASDYPPANSLLASDTTNNQADFTEGWFYQFGIPGQTIPSAGYFSGMHRLPLAQYHVEEYLFPPSNGGPVRKTSPGDGSESKLKFQEAEEGTEILSKPTVPEPSQVANQVSQSLPTQNEMMANFSLGPELPTTKRARKSYSEEGKRKVHAVRANGACTCCKARKLPCSPDGVCETCLRQVNNPSLASHICIRTKMKDDYIGVGDLHQSLARRRKNLQPLTSSLTGLPISVQLCVKSELGIGGDMAQLALQVMRCSSSPICRWKRLQRLSGILVTSDTTYDERYVIVPTALPSVDEFDAFGRRILLMQCISHSGAITWYLDRFLSLYCSRSHPSSMRSLANLTLRIASLNNLVAYGFLNLQDGSFDLLNRPHARLITERYVSETVHDQVRVRVAEGLGPAERLMASELDRLMKIASAGKHARIIAGACLLRLVLIYRDRLVRDKIRISLPKNTDSHQIRLEKAELFYKRLTVAYSMLCREKDTPLTLEWEDENFSPMRERDVALETAYLQLQPAFKDFCEDKLCRQHDEVFQELIAKPLMTQHSRKRRRTSR
ncbi:hypothetical protein BKA64DRAFT_644102 [Cadophora sp. MPI-SDFR-AT-0126]|nr:hypothetical protein BKA64DRAFT_644102 [Leotiomycetes sp. MPI-SDFR-AT-0126]